MRERLFELVDQLRYDPDPLLHEKIVNQLSELLELEYLKGKKMAESLLRIRLGLATKEDEY